MRARNSVHMQRWMQNITFAMALATMEQDAAASGVSDEAMLGVYINALASRVKAIYGEEYAIEIQDTLRKLMPEELGKHNDN
jgi:hypothetical protein